MGRKIGFFGFLQKMTIENSPFYSKEKHLGIMGFFLLVSLVKKKHHRKEFSQSKFIVWKMVPIYDMCHILAPKSGSL